MDNQFITEAQTMLFNLNQFYEKSIKNPNVNKLIDYDALFAVIDNIESAKSIIENQD